MSTKFVKSDIMKIISTVIHIIKPDIKKIILTLILTSPLLYSIIFNTIHPLMSLYLPFLISLCYFGYFDCGNSSPWVVPYYVAYLISFLVAILPWYLVSCLIVFARSKIFRKHSSVNK